MDYETEEQVLFLPFFSATATSRSTAAYLWGCAYGGGLAGALPATTETAN